MLARFRRTSIMARSIFQYISSRQVRFRIYQVYISPIIEWYLPVIMFKPRTSTAKMNAVESFQHQMLCLVSGACTRVSSKELAREMAEMPVSLKLGRLCARLMEFIFRDEGVLRGHGAEAIPTQTRSLRSGKTCTVGWPGADKKDFGDVIYIRAHEYNESETKDLYKKGKEGALTMDPVKLGEWVTMKNKYIQDIIRNRLLGTSAYNDAILDD